MIIIGEKINASSNKVKNALKKKDTDFILELAQKQYEAGASFIDINAGAFGPNEVRDMEWLVNVIQEKVDIPFSIDSPNPNAIEAALKANRKSKPIINSITGEKERYEAILPLVKKYNTAVIALCMDD
ncbi:MAG: dihydropteroate synthase [Clostridiaceae bacterium]|nr:dihydropteroate synthase [Clostridiaceae bacterium]